MYSGLNVKTLYTITLVLELMHCMKWWPFSQHITSYSESVTVITKQ